VASQGGKTILVSSLSFQEASRGDDFQTPAPSAPDPEKLASMRELSLAAGDLNEDFTIIAGGDLDVRMAEPIDWENPVPREPNLQVWMRAMGTVTGEQAENRGLHQALLAYMSDAFLIDVCMVVHGRSFMNASMQVASLDHALWFHDDFRADEWLLHTVEAKRVSGGRGLAYGNFYTRAGKLVASTMQQGLMRFV
jgi:acyl-CoA thioesterase-2